MTLILKSQGCAAAQRVSFQESRDKLELTLLEGNTGWWKWRPVSHTPRYICPMLCSQRRFIRECSFRPSGSKRNSFCELNPEPLFWSIVIDHTQSLCLGYKFLMTKASLIYSVCSLKEIFIPQPLVLVVCCVQYPVIQDQSHTTHGQPLQKNHFINHRKQFSTMISSTNT